MKKHVLLATLFLFTLNIRSMDLVTADKTSHSLPDESFEEFEKHLNKTSVPEGLLLAATRIAKYQNGAERTTLQKRKSTEEERNNTLSLAVKNNSKIEILKELISLGVNINAKIVSSGKYTLLEYVACEDCFTDWPDQKCKLLIDLGADANDNKKRSSILGRAFGCGAIETYKAMIKKHPEIFTENHGGNDHSLSNYHFLLLAILNDQEESCSFLMRNGVSLTNRGNPHRTIGRAVQNGKTKALRGLLSNALFFPDKVTELNSKDIIMTSFLCLQRCAPKLYMIKDIRYLILHKDQNLRDHLLKLLTPKLKRGEDLPTEFLELMIQELYKSTIDQLKVYMLSVLALATNEESKNLIDPSHAEENFGNQLQASIRSRLTSCEKVLPNDETIPEQPSVLCQYRNHILLGLGTLALVWVVKKILPNSQNSASIEKTSQEDHNKPEKLT